MHTDNDTNVPAVATDIPTPALAPLGAASDALPGNIGAADAKRAKREAAKRAASGKRKPAADKPAPAPEAAATPDTAAGKAERLAVTRDAIRAAFTAITAISSIPVKAGFKPEPARCHPNARKPSQRQAAAIAYALAGNGKRLRAGVTFGRSFPGPDGTTVCLENGCLSDAIASGMLIVHSDADGPGREILAVTPAGAKAVQSLLGPNVLKAAGVLAA